MLVQNPLYGRTAFYLEPDLFLAPHFQKHVGEPLCGLPNQAAAEGRPYKMCYFGDEPKTLFRSDVFSFFYLW